MLPSQADGSDDVRTPATPGDQPGALVDQAVVDPARLVVAPVAGPDDLAREAESPELVRSRALSSQRTLVATVATRAGER